MGLSSTAFSLEKLEQLLCSAKATQQSIQSVSHWMLEHRAFLREIVDDWTRLLRDGDANHQIVYLYIANDAMQVGARKYGKHVPETFEPQLLRVAEFIMTSCDESVKRCLMKIVGIWKQRKVVAPSLLQMLQNVCAGKPAVDPTAEAAEATTTSPHDEAAARTALLAQMLSDASIDKALEDLPEVPESDLTATTTQRLQDLSTATISADLLSDRMFQLESSLSAFHAATDAFTTTGVGDIGDSEISGGSILWPMLEQHVFELDIDRSRDHVQQYRDTLEAQSAKRDALLAHLDALEHAELFAEPLFVSALQADAAAAREAQCHALEQLFHVCADAEAIERKREAEAHAAYAAASTNSNGHGSSGSHSHSSSRSRSRHDAPALRRHSSSDATRYYDKDAYNGSKRPKLQHAHSVDLGGGNARRSRWDLQRAEGDARASDYYRDPPYHDENRDAQVRYAQPQQQQVYGQQQQVYGHEALPYVQQQQYGHETLPYGQQQQVYVQQQSPREYHRDSSSRWDARGSNLSGRDYESRDRRW